MALQHRWSGCIPHMQWDHQDKLEIQDTQKIIPVQVIQGPIQEHRRRMGSELLHGRWLHKQRRHPQHSYRSWWNQHLEWNNYGQSHRSRNTSGSEWSISQIRQVPISLQVLEPRTKVTKPQSTIQGRLRLPQVIHTKIQQFQTPEHYGGKPSLHI